ncbi:hypothetical protein EBV26_14345 [bacterium]|nr:hypothetical protein [bacterium]
MSFLEIDNTCDEIAWVNETNSTNFQLQALWNDNTDNNTDNTDGQRSGGENDADAVFYVKLSDMLSVFKFRTPTVSDTSLNLAIFDASSDIQYYVFRKCWPTSLKINPSHAMLDRNESTGMLIGGGSSFTANKSLVKHDFIRYISLRLFNTIHGVDFLSNEDDLLENIVYYGEAARVGIMAVLDTISTQSADITMDADASGNRYLTNAVTSTTNISRELLRQIYLNAPERLAAFSDSSGVLLSVPLFDNDTLNIKVVLEPSPGQHTLTNVSVILPRVYNIKLVIKETVGNANDSTNSAVIDSVSFPNAYPYSSYVQDISASNLSVASSVYADGSPPVPIPLIRYGYQGWYYTNSTSWVSPAPITRNRINWYLSPNNAGVTTVGDLRYFRMCLHLFNHVSTPFITVYTQATGSDDYGGWYKSKRTYDCVNGTADDGSSISSNTNYCFYVNWNGFTNAPFTIAHNNVALSNSSVDGSAVGNFNSSEVIFAYSIGTNNTSAAGTVEFILSNVVIGEGGGGGGGGGGGNLTEKEYGFIY